MTSSLTLTKSQWLEEHPRLGVSLVDHLFNRLDGLYPQKFRSSFASPQAIQNWRESWAEGFHEDGVTTKEVKRGIVNSRKMYDWPPSYKEFYAAIKVPEALPVANYAALPKFLTEADKEKGREFMAGIKAMLAKGQV